MHIGRHTLATTIRNLSRGLARAPSIAFLGIYIAVVVVFAFIYYASPLDFYHATGTQEATLIIQKARMLEAFETDIAQWLYRRADSIPHHGAYEMAIENGASTVTVDSMVTILTPIEVHGTFENQQIGGVDLTMARFRLQAVLASVVDRHASPVHGTLSWTTRCQLDHPNSPPPAIMELEPSLFFTPLHATDFKWRASPTTMKMMAEYVAASLGNAGLSPAGFTRALYLSVVTITSLGIGDIVPIDDFARLCISLEAILGWVLVGLFLNALAQEFASAKAGVTEQHY